MKASRQHTLTRIRVPEVYDFRKHMKADKTQAKFRKYLHQLDNTTKQKKRAASRTDENRTAKKHRTIHSFDSFGVKKNHTGLPFSSQLPEAETCQQTLNRRRPISTDRHQNQYIFIWASPMLSCKWHGTKTSV